MRQKAINLDQDRMRALFPSLVEAENGARFPAQVDWFFAEGSTVEVNQNITLSEKNWRLNSMPWVDVEVEPGVIVVCQILGDEAPAETRIPTGVALALLRPGDQGFAWLDDRLPRGGFANIDDAELLAAEEWAPDGAVWRLIDFLTQGLSEIVRDVVADDSSTAISNVGLRSIERTGSTREAVEKLTKVRAAIGLGGETLVDAVLERKCDSGVYASYEWVSSWNALAPVDFRADEGVHRVGIEVKTTKGPHERPFQISTPELREAQTGRPYEIWRVSRFAFDAEELSGAIRRADPSPLVDETLQWMHTRPAGVSIPSVDFDPAHLVWTEPEEAACPVSRVPSPNWASEIDLAS